MSLIKPSQENGKKVPEIRLQGDSEINEFVPEDQKYKKISQMDLRAISPLSFLKEEQIKDGVLKVFKDKDSKTELEDCSSSQVENKRTNSTLDLLKLDFNQFKEDITSVFSIGASKDKETKQEDGPSSQIPTKPASDTLSLLKEDLTQFGEGVLKVFKDRDAKTQLEDFPLGRAENKLACRTLGLLKEDCSQMKEALTNTLNISSSKDKELKTGEKTLNRLSLLKEDLNQFRDDLSNVFKIGILKEKDSAKEDSSHNFKIETERTQAFTSLFRRDQKTSQKVENTQEVKMTFVEMGEGQTDDGFGGDLSTGDAETVDTTNWTKELEGNDLDTAVREEKTETSVSETELIEERIAFSQADGPRCGSEEWGGDTSLVSAEDERINTGEEEEEEEEKSSEILPLESLCPGISLLSPNKDETRDKPGDELWSVKNFACYLTFDPNTANSELHLTEANRKATRLWQDRHSSDHPDQFKCCPQVLCREGFLDSVYWEVAWSGGADIGVTYNSLSRDGDTASCLLGHNEQSWSLECSEGSYMPCHNNRRFKSSSPTPFTRRVGVYLDWPARSLSFYCVSTDTMVHLHTFTSAFSEPLYPAFWVWAYDGSVTLCHVAQDWERLLR